MEAICGEGADKTFLKRKRGVVWGEQETKFLLKLWERSLDDFSKTKRNRHVHENISRRLSTIGVTKTWSEVATKIKNLTNEYRREKTKVLSGESPSQWKLYDHVDRIIGNLPRNDPSLADESCGLELLDSSPAEAAEEDPALSSDSDVKIFIKKIPQEPEVTIREVTEKQLMQCGSSSGRESRKRRTPIYTDDEDDDDEEEDEDFDYKTQYIRLKKENRKLHEKINVLKKKCDINEDVRRTEKSVIVNLQSLNHRLQTQLLNLL